MTNLEIQWTCKVLHTLVTDSRQRLKRGAELRKQMIEVLESGKKPSGYRPVWIHASAQKVIGQLHGIADEFNNKHPTDQASVDDLLDILATAMEVLRSNSKTAPAPQSSSEPQA